MTVFDVADRYDVRVEMSEDQDVLHHLPESPRWYMFVDLDNRKVLVHPKAHKCVEVAIKQGTSLPPETEATLLHEVVHAIVHPYGAFDTLDEYAEADFLLQFERRLFQTAFKGNKVLLAACDSYQQSTFIDRYTNDERRIPDLSSAKKALGSYGFWRAGLQVCRKVGLLDGQNNVTWDRADWTRLTKEEIQSLRA